MIPAAPRIFPEIRRATAPSSGCTTCVPADPPYVFGSFKGLTDVDPAKITARVTPPTTVWTKNYPVAGFASKCVTNAECAAFG